MREETLLHAEHEDHRKLKALDHVQGNKRHPLRSLLQAVDVAHQGDILEERLQTLARRQAVVLRGQTAKLEHVGPSFLGVRALRLDVPLITGPE